MAGIERASVTKTSANVQTSNFFKMENKKNSRLSGSKSEPKVMSEVLNEYFQSDEPLAVAFRNWVTEREAAKETEEEVAEGDELFRDLWPNTELGINLKLLTRNPGRLPVGVPADGSIVNDGDDHFTFVENIIKKKTVLQRNPIYLRGEFVNVHIKEDGTLYPTFNRPRFNKDLTFQDFCHKAAKELIFFACLIEKNLSRK